MDKHPGTFKEFLVQLTDMELVVLQHKLRRYGDDRPFLDAVLKELGRRTAATAGIPTSRGESSAQ